MLTYWMLIEKSKMQTYVDSFQLECYKELYTHMQGKGLQGDKPKC